MPGEPSLDSGRQDEFPREPKSRSRKAKELWHRSLSLSVGGRFVFARQIVRISVAPLVAFALLVGGFAPAASALEGETCPTWFPDFRCKRSGRFDGFVAPIQMPYLFEDPFITTGAQLVGIYQEYPGDSIFDGGHTTGCWRSNCAWRSPTGWPSSPARTATCGTDRTSSSFPTRTASTTSPWTSSTRSSRTARRTTS